MTIIAGFRFKEGAVMLADSRVTWDSSQSKIFSDNIQKIIPLGRKLGIAYAGNVTIANNIIQQLRQNIKKKNRLTHPQKLAHEVSRIARHHFQKYGKLVKNDSTSLLLGGVDSAGNISLWAYNSPDFNKKEIPSGFVIGGSGAVAAQYFKDNYRSIESQHNDLKKKADELIMGLNAALSAHSVDTVGGFLQIILLTSQGIRPMRYGYIDMDPDSPGESKSITMEKGKWIQHDESKNEDIHILEPSKILQSKPAEKRFYEYQKTKRGDKGPRLYLNYFITCLKVEKDIGETTFEGVMSQIGSEKYPIRCPLVASLAFWGTGLQGIYDLTFRIDMGNKVQTLITNKIDIQLLPDRFEVDTNLTLEISTPGPVFLECLIDNHLIARKALYFGKVSKSDAKSNEDQIAFIEKIATQLAAEHYSYTDAFLNDKKIVIEYFDICQKYAYEGARIKFSGEVRGVYWEKYPLLFKALYATAYRLKKGNHNLRLDLVNIATRETINIANKVLTSESDCKTYHVYGELVIKIPKSGLYWANLYVDNELAGVALLPAEKGEGNYSYSLRDEDSKRVKAGELLLLLQRSKTAVK